METIIIEVENGAVQAAYSTNPECRVIIADRDMNGVIRGQVPISDLDINSLHEKATENCQAEIKAGKFFRIF